MLVMYRVRQIGLMSSLLFLLGRVLYGQSYEGRYDEALSDDTFTVVSFNVENLFDTIPDPFANDKEFLPNGVKQWTGKRYNQKIRKLSEALSQVGGLFFPWFVALQEIENEAVVKDLVESPALRGACYKFVVSEGKDPRGIDVALLYAEGLFTVDKVEQWALPTPRGYIPKASRPILCVTGKLLGRYPLVLMVVHLPSNRGGKAQSLPYKMGALSFLQEKCDSLLYERPDCAFILLGDFNCTFDDTRGSNWITCYDKDSKIEPSKGYDLSFDRSKESYWGSYYYQKKYSQIDRMILSYHFFDKVPNTPFYYVKSSFTNCPLQGKMRKLKAGYYIPLRTYGGDHYIGGTSDHLPIKATFRFATKPL